MDAPRRGPSSGSGHGFWALSGAFGVLVLAIEGARHVLQPLPTHSELTHLGLDVALVAATAGMVALFVRRSVAVQEDLSRENGELVKLYQAALDVYGELDLGPLLEKIVESSATLLDARYGAVSVVHESGRVSQFVTAGGKEMESWLTTPEVGGFVDLVRDRGRRLRIPGPERDMVRPASPGGHPVVTSLLGVPIRPRGPFRGAVFVGEKRSASRFSAEDEAVLARFAGAAAVAIDNAHHHEHLHALAVIEERDRIGREMHDGVAQTLAYVNAKAQAAELLLARGRADEAGAQLGQLVRAAREAYTDARASILDLRVDHGGRPSFLSEIQDYLVRWREVTRVTVNARVDGDVRVAPRVELQLARVVQEALANVRKHSGAKRVDVELERRDGRVVVTVADDGRGFDPHRTGRAAYPRFGLGIMKERAESVGGSLILESTPGVGTRVVLEVPAAQEGD